MEELFSDIVKKGQEIDRLIEALSGISRTEEEQLRLLQNELGVCENMYTNSVLRLNDYYVGRGKCES
jgi:hypothetical protein